MRVCVITDKPSHTTLAATAQLLRTTHEIEWIDPDAESSAPLPRMHEHLPAPLYLLKAHTARAIAFAASVEQRHARVINRPAATERSQDRMAMANLAMAAGLPFPQTSLARRVADLLRPSRRSTLHFPVIVKSQHSRRGDLVARANDPSQLAGLAAEWPDEPIVVQDFAANDGWDHKLWVVGTEVFAAMRTTPLLGSGLTQTAALDPSDLPPGWCDMVRVTGAAFGLEVYGVDMLATAAGPLIVDVNAFPGGRGVPGVPDALAALVEASLLEGRHARRIATG